MEMQPASDEDREHTGTHQHRLPAERTWWSAHSHRETEDRQNESRMRAMDR